MRVKNVVPRDMEEDEILEDLVYEFYLSTLAGGETRADFDTFRKEELPFLAGMLENWLGDAYNNKGEEE